MMNLSILEIEKACGGKLVLKDAEGSDTVSSVVLDSRQVTADGVFLATVGERVDGHRFVKDVYDRGVKLVIAEKTPEQVEAEHGIKASDWKSYVLVKDSFQALKDIAEYYRSKLTIPVVGITGSVGKTSTKEFIAGVLSEKYQVLKTEGNFNNEVGLPLTLLRIRSEHEVAVVEMGISDFGEMHRLSKMARPNICVITNIGQCHLENLKTRDGILQAKTEIFDFMAEDGEVCLNGEDDKLRTVTEVKGKKPHFFGLGEHSEEVYADHIVSKGLWGSDAVLHMGECEVPIEVPIPGIHMVMNAAAAACVAKLLGLTPEQISEGIKHVSAIGGRNNLIRLPKYTLIDDCYNANPVSMKAAIDLLTLADTTKVAILGDMFELGTNSDAMHAEVGSYAAQKGIDRIYCVGENSRHMYESALQEAGQAVENARMEASKSVQEILYFATREALLEALSQKQEELIPDGCTVLMKASHGMVFTEVLAYLKEHA
uniref:UDP-N-acetylmuramoyl-tripeptide--D-alanyl-D- alanine ligase n=1 Tax=Acetatifactor sp. TaxID=1872090 RepID=UPI004056E987